MNHALAELFGPTWPLAEARLAGEGDVELVFERPDVGAVTLRVSPPGTRPAYHVGERFSLSYVGRERSDAVTDVLAHALRRLQGRDHASLVRLVRPRLAEDDGAEAPLEPDAIVDGAIALYRRAWSEPERMVAEVLPARWLPAPPEQRGKRTSSHIPVTTLARSGDEPCRLLHNRFAALLRAACIPYQARFRVGFREDEGFILLRYAPGEEFRAHFDGETSTGRHVSFVLFLNDDFEGGELYFPHFDRTIRAEAGTLVAFPASFAFEHASLPVRSGTKVSFVAFAHDHVLDPSRGATGAFPTL